ncbi:MAG: hypothetical protein HC894_08900, partial [Microcoleus sp. SM1_3_4]|nr:hypothetical protein [Microcoleus sp. SM1_3_4]
MIAPSINASVDAILNYNIGGLDAVFSASGFGQDFTVPIPLIPPQQNNLSHEIFNLNSLFSPPKVELTIKEFFKISASLPNLLPSFKTEANGEFSLEVAYKTQEFLSASLALDLFIASKSQGAKTILNPQFLKQIPAPIPLFLDANIRLIPIDFLFALDPELQLKSR